MENKVYKPYTKKFFNEEGRFINANGFEWLITKDMFNWLGRLTEKGQIQSSDRSTLNTFLKNIKQECASESFTITSKSEKSKSRKTQEVDCIKIDVVPMVLTQFEPTKRAGEERHQQWCELMQFINDILMELEVYKFITVDKNYQKDCMERLYKLNPKATQNDYKKVNNDVALIMGQLIGVDFPVYKDTLKIYNNQTTVDLLSVREESLDVYLTFYEGFKDYKETYKLALNVMQQRYKIND